MSILEYNEEEEIKKIRASERRGGYDDGWNAGRIEGEAAGRIAGRIEGEAAGKIAGRIEGEAAGKIAYQKTGKLKQNVKEKFCNTWNIYNIKRRKVL